MPSPLTKAKYKKIIVQTMKLAAHFIRKVSIMLKNRATPADIAIMGQEFLISAKNFSEPWKFITLES